MKEVTYEDWQKNPTSRMMWVWDISEKDKVIRKVIYFIENKNSHYPIVALSSDGVIAACYKHCAEIEEPKTRRMTHKELSRWLREKPTREFKYSSSCSVYSIHTYVEDDEEVEIPDSILIREDDSEWREPLVEREDDSEWREPIVEVEE